MRLAHGQWQRFLLEAPEYPHGVFHGKGIVILAGGPQYLVPAWVNVRMLRMAGKQAYMTVKLSLCKMPAECSYSTMNNTYYSKVMQNRPHK